ncbi:uncharacterized protein LOC135498998 [Lineus longissimus]|uniref:uncharacterized protein LOC135498998 n=1 Tax=Lineus longissimus TaxID=88925 RepID=UPI00315D9148
MEEQAYDMETSTSTEIATESDVNHNSSGTEERPKSIETTEEKRTENPEHVDLVEEICIEATDIYKEVVNIMSIDNDSNVMTTDLVTADVATSETYHGGLQCIGSNSQPIFCGTEEVIVVEQAVDKKPSFDTGVIIEQVMSEVSSPSLACNAVRASSVDQAQQGDFQNRSEIQAKPNIDEQFTVEQNDLDNVATYEIEAKPDINVDMVVQIFSNKDAESGEIVQGDLQNDLSIETTSDVGSGYTVEQNPVPFFEIGTKPQAGVYFIQKDYLGKAVRQNFLGIQNTDVAPEVKASTGVTEVTGIAEEIESTSVAEVNASTGVTEVTGIAEEIESTSVAEVNALIGVAVEIESTGVAEVNQATGEASDQLEKEDVGEEKDTNKRKSSDPDYGKAMEEFMKEHEVDSDGSDDNTIVSSGSDLDEDGESVPKESPKASKVAPQGLRRHEKGAFGIIASPGSNLDGHQRLKGTTPAHSKRSRDGNDGAPTPGPSGEPMVSYMTTGITHRRESPKKRKLNEEGDSQPDKRVPLASPFQFECLKCGNVFKNTGDVCPCTQNTGVPKQSTQNTGVHENTGVTPGTLNTKCLVAMATDLKQKLSEEIGKNDQGNAKGVQIEKTTGKKNARTRMIWYKIPDEFDVEKLNVLNAAYVCAKCDHRGDINGCSCKKPGIFGTKMFRYKCLEHCGREFFNRRDYENHQRMHLNVRPFACGLCDKTFTSKNLMNRHSQVHVGDKPHKCDECHKRFMFRRDMEIHARTHTGEKTFICEDCGNAYTSETNLQIHRLSHTGGEPFRCRKCEKVYLSKSLRDIHELSHTGEGPFPCQFCGRLFNGQSNLIRHKKRVHKEKNPPMVTCYSCRAAFNNCDELLEHCQQHYTEPAHKCQHCSKEYVTKVELEAHERRHQSVHAKPFKCDECSRCFLSDHNLQKHRKLHTNGSSFSCWICDEKFTDRAVLSEHMKRHRLQGKEGLWCKICKKGFANASNFVRHRKAHNLAESPHICAECGAIFATNWKLKNHKVLHSDEKPFACKNCPKTFKTAESLKGHQKIHSETKPFICQTCGKCFRSKAHLSIHKRIHTGVYPFKCKECGRNFICSSNLKAHMLTRHSQVVYKIGDATVGVAKQGDKVKPGGRRRMNEKGDAYPISVPVVALGRENEASGSYFRPRKVPMATATVSRRKRAPRNLTYTLRGCAQKEEAFPVAVAAVDYSSTGLNRRSGSDPQANKPLEFSDQKQNDGENSPNTGLQKMDSSPAE